MQVRRFFLAILLALLSVAVSAQRFASTTSIATDTQVATNFWRSGSLVYVVDQENWRRITQDWAIGVAFNAISSVPSGGTQISSNANEMIMNVAGTVQGQSQFTYDPVSNLLNIGLGHVLTNTNQNNNLNWGNGNDYLGTGLIRHSQMIGHNHVMNASTGSIQWSLALGEQHNMQTTSTGVINNSIMLSGFNNDIINNSTFGSFNSFILGSASASVLESGIQRVIISSASSSILESANYSGVYSGQSNTLGTSSTHSAILGGQGINTGTATHTVFMPRLRVGLGTSGALADAVTANRVLLRDTGDGSVNQALANVIPMAAASPALAQDGQTLSWNNTSGNWEYAALGGGDFWALTGTSTLTGTTLIDGAENGFDLSFGGVDNLNFESSVEMDVITNTLDLNPNNYTLDATSIDITLNNVEPANETLSINHNDGAFSQTSIVLSEVSSEEVITLNSQDVSNNTSLRVRPGTIDMIFDASTIRINGDYIRTISLPLTNSQLLAINTTPVVAIPAPGAGKAIMLIGRPYFSYDHVATNFGAINDDISVVIGNTEAYRLNNALAGSFDTFTVANFNLSTNNARTAVENQAVSITSLNGDPTLGGGSGIIYFQYRIIDL